MTYSELTAYSLNVLVKVKKNRKDKQMFRQKKPL